MSEKGQKPGKNIMFFTQKARVSLSAIYNISVQMIMLNLKPFHSDVPHDYSSITTRAFRQTLKHLEETFARWLLCMTNPARAIQWATEPDLQSKAWASKFTGIIQA
jgi:hypothetical protein